ncbi:hypothetical protein VLK31_20680 [Variovorax sp. H27-G14]|uniref:hypothetical protein n=1 Tax=Variovorax sp. H27-G14 TaxID=3111914 RepID=UPI0038FCB495
MTFDAPTHGCAADEADIRKRGDQAAADESADGAGAENDNVISLHDGCSLRQNFPLRPAALSFRFLRAQARFSENVRKEQRQIIEELAGMRRIWKDMR